MARTTKKKPLAKALPPEQDLPASRAAAGELQRLLAQTHGMNDCDPIAIIARIRHLAAFVGGIGPLKKLVDAVAETTMAPSGR